MVKFIDKCSEPLVIPTMASNLACNSINAASAVTFAEELANRARPATAKRLRTIHIEARAIHLLQDAMDVQTLQGNRAIQVKALMSVVRSSCIHTSSAATGRF